MKFDIYTSSQYFDELIQLISRVKSGERVLLASMRYEPSEAIILKLTEAMVAAAKRGVKVSLIIDALSFWQDRNNLPIGPIAFGRPISASSRKQFRDKYLILEKLRQSGGKYYVVNTPRKPFGSSLFGRSHIKCAIVSDTVFVGGCNLGWTWFTDYMVKFTDQKSADWLDKIVTSAGKDGNVLGNLAGLDQIFRINAENTLLIDAGKPKQSVIYNEALKFIDASAQSLTMTCQYFPSSKTVKHLNAAIGRGAKVDLYYNSPSHQPIHERWGHYGLLQLAKSRNPKQLFTNEIGKNKPRLHAKILASENGLIIGSHNYMTQGVTLGTAEIALVSTNQKLRNETLAIVSKSLA